MASIAQGAAGRAASRSGSSRKTKEDKNLEEMYRTLGIIQTINNDELSDDDKRTILMKEYDVDASTSNDAIKGYNDNRLLDETNARINKLSTNLENSRNFGNRLNEMGANDDLSWVLSRFPATLNDWYGSLTENKLNKNRNKINGLTYQDLNEILFGNK